MSAVKNFRRFRELLDTGNGFSSVADGIDYALHWDDGAGKFVAQALNPSGPGYAEESATALDPAILEYTIAFTYVMLLPAQLRLYDNYVLDPGGRDVRPVLTNVTDNNFTIKLTGFPSAGAIFYWKFVTTGASVDPGPAPATPVYVLGGTVFEAKAFKHDDDPDWTLAVSRAITAASADPPSSIVRLPSGVLDMTGNFDLSGLDGLRIEGAGSGSTIINLTHATNNLFYTRTGTSSLYLADFTVTSDSVTRTDGWIFKVSCLFSGTGYLRKSIFERIDIRKQKNGIWMAMYEFVTLRDITGYEWVGSGGIGIKIGQATSSDVNQGSECRLDNCQMYGNDLLGGPSVLSYGYWIEDCDAVYFSGGTGGGGVLESDLTIKANLGGHPPANLFFSQSIFDATTNGPSVHITGGGAIQRVKFIGCWFCSSGQNSGGSSTANGLLVDCGLFGDFEIIGCNSYNVKATALYINPASCVNGVIVGNTLSSFGTGGVTANKDGLYLNVPLNFIGPIVTGNAISGSGVAIRTSNTSNLVTIGANSIAGGVAFGIPPIILSSNDAWTAYDPTPVPGTGSFGALGPAIGSYQKIGTGVDLTVDVTITTNGSAAGVYIPLPVGSGPGTYILSGIEVVTGKRVSMLVLPGTLFGVIALTNYDSPNVDGYHFWVTGKYESG